VSEIVPASVERVRFRAVAEAHPGTRFGPGWTVTPPGYACPTALAGLLDELRASGPGTVARTRRPVRRARALAGLADFAARPVHVHGLGGKRHVPPVLLAPTAREHPVLRLLC